MPGDVAVFDAERDPAPRGGYPTAVIQGGEHDETLFPVLGVLVPPRGPRTQAWIYRERIEPIDAPDLAAAAEVEFPAAMLRLSTGLMNRLGLSSGAAKVGLELPQRLRLTVKVPPAIDLPRPGNVHVSATVYRRFRATGRRAVLTTEGGLCVPVRLRARRVAEETVLVPMSLRTLAGITSGSSVQLSSTPSVSLAERRTRAVQRVVLNVPRNRLVALGCLMLGWLLMIGRVLDYGFELLLRWVFGCQPLSFRIIQAHPGDDDLRDTARLHPAVFTALGVRPGGQVVMDWAGKRIAVRVLEDQSPFDAPKSAYVLGIVGVRYDPGPPADFPAHLIARIPASMRRHLGIPPSTVIEVRRRIRPALIGQLNSLALPIAGLVLTGAAVPAVRGWPLVLGAIVAALLGLAPLRMPRPPRGPWP